MIGCCHSYKNMGKLMPYTLSVQYFTVNLHDAKHLECLPSGFCFLFSQQAKYWILPLEYSQQDNVIRSPAHNMGKEWTLGGWKIIHLFINFSFPFISSCPSCPNSFCCNWNLSIRNTEKMVLLPNCLKLMPLPVLRRVMEDEEEKKKKTYQVTAHDER